MSNNSNDIVDNNQINNKGSLERIMGVLGNFQNSVAIACFIFMSIFVLAGVAMRFILKIPFTWGEEISRYLMVCGVLIGISMGVREKAHLGVEIFINIMPQKMSLVVQIIGNWITTLAYIILVYLSYLFIISNYKFGQRSPALNLPMYLVYCILFVGFFLSAIENIIIFYKDYIVKKAAISDGEGDGTL